MECAGKDAGAWVPVEMLRLGHEAVVAFVAVQAGADLTVDAGLTVRKANKALADLQAHGYLASQPTMWGDTPESPRFLTTSNDDGFEQFWKQYPRKVEKVKAAEQWAKMTPADRQAALAALPRHVTAWRGRERYVVYAERWLARRRWEDEMGAAPGERGAAWLAKFASQGESREG